MHSKYKVNSLHDTESINTGVGWACETKFCECGYHFPTTTCATLLAVLVVVHWFTTRIFLATFDVMR